MWRGVLGGEGSAREGGKRGRRGEERRGEGGSVEKGLTGGKDARGRGGRRGEPKSMPLPFPYPWPCLTPWAFMVLALCRNYSDRLASHRVALHGIAWHQVEEHREQLAEARLRFVGAVKANYQNNFRKGWLSDSGLRVLQVGTSIPFVSCML